MGNYFRQFISFITKNRRIPLLALSLGFALSLAVFLASMLEESFLLLMRAAVSDRVSIVGLFAVSYLPFLISAFAVFIRKPRLLYAVMFIKMLLIAFCGLSCLAAYPSAGWLVRILLQFSDLLLVPVLCWFSLRHVCGAGNLKRDFSFCTALFVFVCSLDYCVVSPFLVMLIDN